REALARLDAARTDRDFEAELSLALVALAGGKLGPARAHFEAARALRPDSAEVIDGLRQLQQIESSRAIAKQRALAEAAELDERWSDAASHYQAILETQPHLPFAEQGLRRNRELARVTERIAQLLADPAQLLHAANLDEARRLGESARTAASGKPKLGDQIRQLDAAIELASTPISVAFESDAATEVVIRGVGTLGSFARRDLALKPGRYVVIGRRDGYRDTRTEISVVPGARPPVVDVRCTEKI
ncbi:MAG TPA: hypothetical protein VEC18_03495, partial [Myxococcota bacterium]|nr:hypothetical protein [Myxococcota bacterium]